MYFVLLPASVHSLHAQPFSPSKLSAHLINSYTTGASNLVAGQPRVLKILIRLLTRRISGRPSCNRR
ncbi:MAG: hypothetical protein DME24_18010 [Verrucomicrobia bacterium]|nr:MAG: hypothetical protein DME24_18010 [Verrucomicrobiota bacterium]